jgi:hypothetical protein
MATTATSKQLDAKLADRAAKVLRVNSRTEAIPIALKETAALEEFKGLMVKYRGKVTLAGEQAPERIQQTNTSLRGKG